LREVTFYDTYEKALEQRFDAIIICNPTVYHLNFAIPAAKAGCHLYIEKPLSHSMDGVDELLLWVRRNRLKVTVGYQLRFHPNILAIQRWIESERIGELLAVHAEIGEYLPNWHPWEDYRDSYAARRELGGGVVLTQIHEIDYLLWLFGPLQVINAFGGNSGALEINVEDHAACLMLMGDRCPVFLQMDYLQNPPRRNLKIVGSHGVITWDYHQGSAQLWAHGQIADLSEVPADWERNDLFMGILKNFLNAVHTSEQCQATLEDGIRSLKVALDIKNRLQ